MHRIACCALLSKAADIASPLTQAVGFVLCCAALWLQALGLDEGHAVCQSLQAVKLAVNAGCYSSLESASGAVAVCVLADWFEGFKQEAFSEATLELLVDDAEALLAAALASGTGAGGKAQEPQQQQDQGSSSGSGSRASAMGAAGGGGLAVVQESAQEGMTPVDDPVILAQRASARAMCSALAPYEQDLCLLLAAMLRHARHASLEDPRLQEYGLGSMTGGSNGAGGSGGRVSAGGGGSGSSSQWALVEAQVDAAMAVLYRLVAGWLLGPLALVCVPALEAVAAFLHYLSVDDTAYGWVLAYRGRLCYNSPHGSSCTLRVLSIVVCSDRGSSALLALSACSRGRWGNV